ncbi:TetR/AcrR family transcriptional regulator [Paenibacillus glycinis]|uniref:TetR family transcriptional regulator n=1 Tax=Paenibacillus glycinis TaxID=2697035 RepID=A0ABW9XQM4_9BACL|nr:TetR/AcrR family transcriptional regulator [Paenibacillus glycinis]NBD24952.1 TetR family transcriptional regulator [Paenibacillus glycinis]
MDNRKTQIIDLATSLIRKKGYSTFTFDEISKHLSLTKASIHYHFGKKEDLGLAVLDQSYQSLINFKSIVQLPSQSIEEKLIEYFRYRSKRFEEYDICPLTSLTSDYELLPESMRQKLLEIAELELCIIEEIVRKGQTDPAINMRALAITILSAVKGALLYNRSMRDNFIPDILYGINRLLK